MNRNNVVGLHCKGNHHGNIFPFISFEIDLGHGACGSLLQARRISGLCLPLYLSGIIPQNLQDFEGETFLKNNSLYMGRIRAGPSSFLI